MRPGLEEKNTFSHIMFTGIVEQIGQIIGIERRRTGLKLKIRVSNISKDAKLGDSVSVNGACLSVTDIKGTVLGFDVIHETVRRTTLGELKLNDRVNLERSLKVNSGIDGHFVTGHVDYKAKLEGILKNKDEIAFKISMPDEFSTFIVEKGSISVDGVSLTVAEVAKNSFTVYLIPHTLNVTTFGDKRKGSSVNIETDLLAKYVVKQSQRPNLQETLKKYEYI